MKQYAEEKDSKKRKKIPKISVFQIGNDVFLCVRLVRLLNQFACLVVYFTPTVGGDIIEDVVATTVNHSTFLVDKGN